jgi:hypothetical protein
MYYTAIERFDPDNGERWVCYTRWLGRSDLKRVVTLDSLLCPSVVHVESGNDWEFVAKEDLMLDFFTDLDFVLRRVPGHRPSVVVAVTREPTDAEVSGFTDPRFEFAGFDVVDTQLITSALLSSSRIPGVFNVSELSGESGLILSRERAYEIRETLRRKYPDREKAKCNVWAIWRYTGNA